MDTKTRKICDMLRHHDPELQCAAARILGELRAKETGVTRGLGQAATGTNPLLRVYALRALGQIASKDAWKYLLPALEREDAERDAAIDGLTRLGSSILPKLKTEFRGGTLRTQLALAAVVIRMRSPQAVTVMLDYLLEGEEEVLRQIGLHFRERAEQLAQKEKDGLFSRLVRFLDNRKVVEHEAAFSAAIRMVGYLRHSRAKSVLLKCLKQAKQTRVRTDVLIALGRLELRKSDFSVAAASLLPLLRDDDYTNVAEPALRILSQIQIPAKFVDEVISLLGSRYGTVRRLGVRVLGRFESAKAAEAILRYLDMMGPELSGEAIASLRRNPMAVRTILKDLDSVKTRERAGILAQVLRGSPTKVPKPVGQKLIQKLLEKVGQSGDQADILLTLASAVDPAGAEKHLLDQVKQHKRAGRYPRAEEYLRFAGRIRPLPLERRVELAALRLKTGAHGLARHERLSDPALAQIGELLRDGAEPVAKALLAQSSILTPDDFHYLGFHFAEGIGRERDLGAALLRHLQKGAPRSDLGKAALNKLRAEGLAPRGRAKAAAKPPRPTRAKAAAKKATKKAVKKTQKPAAKKTKKTQKTAAKKTKKSQKSTAKKKRSRK